MEKQEFVNPIDDDKVAIEPHLLPYAHSVGGVVIKPTDKGRIKGRAVASMYQQTDIQLGQLRKQIELLAKQAEDIRKRVLISEKIYEAEIAFQPLVGFVYHLYAKRNGLFVLSMISPEEWGPNPPYIFQATVKLFADHTWEILKSDEDFLP
jgi:hypothetical protein